MYRGEGRNYPHDFSQAPPIVLVEDQNKAVTIFLDNIWGINNCRLLNHPPTFVPEMIKQTWASISDPYFQQIISDYYSTLSSLDDAVDTGRLPDYKYQSMRYELDMDYWYTRHNYTQEHNLDILEGIKRDLSASVNSFFE